MLVRAAAALLWAAWQNAAEFPAHTDTSDTADDPGLSQAWTGMEESFPTNLLKTIQI